MQTPESTDNANAVWPLPSTATFTVLVFGSPLAKVSLIVPSALSSGMATLGLLLLSVTTAPSFSIRPTGTLTMIWVPSSPGPSSALTNVAETQASATTLKSSNVCSSSAP